MSISTASTATPPRQAFDALLDDVKVSKADFNYLIMDYLVSQGYPLAAQRFATEANMKLLPAADSITQRVAIREAIHTGDIQTAIEQINVLNPRLLDENTSLHFALLRLQLVELIRKAISVPNGDITAALDFATAYLAPRAPTEENFLFDLERTMALLIFPPDNLSPELARLLQPELRKEVAKCVNEALLQGQGEQAQATLYHLVRHRAWAHAKVVKERKDSVPETIDLGLDPAVEQRNGKSATTSSSGPPIEMDEQQQQNSTGASSGTGNGGAKVGEGSSGSTATATTPRAAATSSTSSTTAATRSQAGAGSTRTGTRSSSRRTNNNNNDDDAAIPTAAAVTAAAVEASWEREPPSSSP